MRKYLFTLFFAFLTAGFSSSSFATTHILKFEGVPATMSAKIKQAFGYVFEREVNPSEAEQVMRFLMATQEYSNIEVHERFPEGRPAEYVIVASLLRTIKGITVTGSSQFSKSQVIQKLKIDINQIFTRKEILANADDLQTEYAEQGYLNPQIDIDFETPKDTEIIIHINIKEGEPSTITDIGFDCLNPEIAIKAKKLSRSMLGSRLSNPRLKDFENAMKDFFSRNRYLRARISSPNLAFNKERNKVKINYVIDNPTQYEFVFEGNHFFTDGQLLDSIELEKVIGATTSFAPDLSDRIRRNYLNAGFANMQVEFKEKSFEKTFLEQVRFKISEGVRVRIRTLVVDGQISQPEKYYSNFIRDNSSDTIAMGYYNRRDLEAGQKNLITELQNQGFLQAKILSPRTSFSKSKEMSDTNITIDEGPVTLIKEINFKANDTLSSEVLRKQMLVQPGSAFKQKELEQSIRAIKDYYHSLGYLEMKILNEDDKLVEFNSDNTEARLNFLIQEGPKVIVASIEIQGLSFTKPEVVKREISFSPGEVLTPDKVEETTYHLQKLQLFSSVQIKTDADGTNIPRRVVIITVSEYDAGNLNPGIGINNENQLTYRGFLNFGYRNLFGTGRGVSARGELWYSTDPAIQYLENRITLGYFEPWLFNSRNNGRINLTRQERFSSKDGNGAAVIENLTSSDFLIERDLTRHLKLTFYALEFTRRKDFYSRNQAGAPGFVDNTTLLVDVAKIGPSFELDYRNDIFNPTRGTDSILQLFYSDPLIGSSGDAQQYVHFFKTENSVTNYLPVTKSERWIWVNQARSGYIANLSQNSNVYRGQPVSGFPSAETKFLGGATTIRGFDVNEKIPNIYDLQPNGNGDITSFKYTVESYYYLLKSELRFPLYKAFGGALFYDAGGVFANQPGTDSPDTYRDSAGFGIRLNTPVGPINLDLGFKLHPRLRRAGLNSAPQQESPFAFHFTVGNF